MEQGFRKLILTCALMLAMFIAKAQTAKIQQGAVLRKGTAVRVANVRIQNKRAGNTALTDNLGIFSIAAIPGDTLLISSQGYIERQFITGNFADAVIYLTPSIELAAVTVSAQSVRQRLQEVEDDFRSKGIYYKGRPPLILLSPFGGSPLTFFYELLSKDGKRARRFHKYAEGELLYAEISARFNDNTIRSAIPIKEEDLVKFRTDYWPKTEQIRNWTDFELLEYIKTSYQGFIGKKKP